MVKSYELETDGFVFVEASKLESLKQETTRGIDLVQFISQDGQGKAVGFHAHRRLSEKRILKNRRAACNANRLTKKDREWVRSD